MLDAALPTSQQLSLIEQIVNDYGSDIADPIGDMHDILRLDQEFLKKFGGDWIYQWSLGRRFIPKVAWPPKWGQGRAFGLRFVDGRLAVMRVGRSDKDVLVLNGYTIYPAPSAVEIGTECGYWGPGFSPVMYKGPIPWP